MMRVDNRMEMLQAHTDKFIQTIHIFLQPNRMFSRIQIYYSNYIKLQVTIKFSRQGP